MNFSRLFFYSCKVTLCTLDTWYITVEVWEMSKWLAPCFIVSNLTGHIILTSSWLPQYLKKTQGSLSVFILAWTVRIKLIAGSLSLHFEIKGKMSEYNLNWLILFLYKFIVKAINIRITSVNQLINRFDKFHLDEWIERTDGLKKLLIYPIERKLFLPRSTPTLEYHCLHEKLSFDNEWGKIWLMG